MRGPFSKHFANAIKNSKMTMQSLSRDDFGTFFKAYWYDSRLTDPPILELG
jgi:hypothetical protein